MIKTMRVSDVRRRYDALLASKPYLGSVTSTRYMSSIHKKIVEDYAVEDWELRQRGEPGDERLDIIQGGMGSNGY